MKRWFVLLMTTVLVASMGAAALADDETSEDEGSEPTELNDKQLQRAEALAAFFAPRLSGDDGDGSDESGETTGEAAEALTEQIVALRTGEPSTGWGALYKLIILAEYHGEDLETVAAEVRSDGGWGFGKAMKELREDAEWRESSDTPKNLGQFKKQQREAKGQKKSGDD